jgi:predicted DNA-binding transcriptional regulator YafY
MRGDHLARQWRILRTIESRNQSATVAELAAQEACFPRTLWRYLAAIQNAQLPLLFQFNPMRDSRDRREVQLSMPDLQRRMRSMTMEVEGLVEVMSWVMAVSEVVPQGALSFQLCAQLPISETQWRKSMQHWWNSMRKNPYLCMKKMLAEECPN